MVIIKNDSFDSFERPLITCVTVKPLIICRPTPIDSPENESKYGFEDI